MQKIKFGKKIISTERPAFVMGILNVTTDSFYENSTGGVEEARKIISLGADIIDIGGESTRPGFKDVSADEQIKRIIPVIKEIRKESNIPISVDTRSAKVLEGALDAGADVLNDVSSLEGDSDMINIAAKNECGVILMHGFGLQEKQGLNPNIVDDVKNYLKKRTDFAISNGILQENIFWDMGIGFGKSNEENVFLIKNTDNLCKENFPVVMALSRKRVIGFMTGKDIKDRGPGTIAANEVAVQKGARILRVHDISETIDMLNVMKNLQ